MKKTFPAIAICLLLLLTATFVRAEEDGNIPTGGFADCQQTCQSQSESVKSVWQIVIDAFGLFKKSSSE